MTMLTYTGFELALSRDRDPKAPICLINFELQGTGNYYSLGGEDVELATKNDATPYAKQVVGRYVNLGSQLVLVAPMKYSAKLAEGIATYIRQLDDEGLREGHIEEPGAGGNPFFEALSAWLKDRHAPLRELNAIREDFGYILAYLPRWKVSYRRMREDTSKDYIRYSVVEAAHRPLYCLRENAYLSDYRKRLIHAPQTISGRSPALVAEWNSFDDVMLTTIAA